MNKQFALQKLHNISHKFAVLNDDDDLIDLLFDCTVELDELVKKSTPMKPTFVESYPSGECPNCNESIGSRNYCSNCGQAIDWSE